nr:hypothetical protein [Bacteroidota bacterium]
MKTLAILFSMLVLLTFNGYSQNVDIKGLLDKPETRTEIFNTILNDHVLMTDFMKSMKGNEHAMMMMKENQQMMGNDGKMEMKDEHQMMGMMKDNPEMMQKMMGNMMDMSEQDSTMRNKMADMMTEHPRMMQMCMQKMKDKGMMGPDGKMKMMDAENQSGNKEHHHQH